VGEFDQRTLDKLYRDLGDELKQVLEAPDTVEVLLNPDGRLWHERLGAPMHCIGHLAPSRAEAVIKTLATHLGTEVTRSRPLLEGELPPHGYRFAGQLPPVVSAPSFAIRKPAVARLTLSDYVRQGALSERQAAVVRQAIEAHRNVLVVGGTGSGKTTFVNALIAHMVSACPSERIVVLEDTREIQCSAENTVQLRTSAEVSLQQLLRATLRMRPDRILVGEVRGPEALDLLMAWSTGHPGGAATLHANNAATALTRLETLVSMHPQAPRPMQPLLAEVMDVLVHIARTARGRRVEQIRQVTGHGPHGYQTEPLD
jgi:P-type conjugative transfer ATPase TrbB